MPRLEFIVLGTAKNLWKNTLDNIEIGNTKIHWSSKIKFLGVLLDDKLSLKDHIPNRSEKAIYNLRLISNICKYINIDTTKMLLCTLVLSQLDYVNSILSRAPKLLLNHTKQSKILQPEWPTKSQEERIFTHAYKNCIGCPSNIEPCSKC